jgi:hypothetical protein
MVSTAISIFHDYYSPIRCSYIVDFEECYLFNVKKKSPPEFTDNEFRYWQLDEESAQDYRRSYLRLTDDE